jgi:hypothetical protein
MIDHNAITARLVEAGEEWADMEAAAQLLEETRKPLKGNIMAELLADKKPVTAAESLAYADNRYVDHVTKMVDARKAANKAKVRYESGRIFTELLRTKEATKRAEMSMK